MSTAHVLTVGAAALDGEDAAGRLIARALLSEGLPVASRQIVDEDEAALDMALGRMLATAELIVILAPEGGSSGDIVRRVLARATESRLVLNDRLLALLEEDFTRRGQAMPHRLERLALLPQGATLWAAPSGESGWAMETRAAVIAVLPAESPHLPTLVAEHLTPLARRRIGGEVRVLRTLLTAGVSPADVEERLGSWLGRGGTVSVSSVVVERDVWVRMSARGVSREAALAELHAIEPAVRSALGDDCYGADGDRLEAVIGGLLTERALSVSVAESCTGGLLAHRLTTVPSASRYFDRGVTAYSNRAKEEVLGVPEALLAARGAVSAQVAESMVNGVCRLSGSPCGLAVTGLTGPDGGTPSKPVGTVFIAARTPVGLEVRHFGFGGGRHAVRSHATQAALDMLRRALLRARNA